jgi:uncharacterized protein (TIGR02147 family)
MLIDMKPHIILKKHFEKKKKERSGFSLRFLSRRLGISHAYISQMLSGKRGIPLRVMEQFCDLLDIDRETRDFLIASVLQGKGLKRTKTSVAGALTSNHSARADWQPIPKKKFRLLIPWYVMAVADATLLRDYDGTEPWVAKKLGLPLPKVEQAFRLLQDEGLVVEANGLRKKVSRFVEFSSASTEEIRTFHRGQLENAIQALGNPSAEAREKRLITGLFLTGSEEDVAWAKQRLLATLHEVAERLGRSEPESVYQLSLQFIQIGDK